MFPCYWFDKRNFEYNIKWEKVCGVWKKWKLSIESVSAKLIISVDLLKSPNPWRLIEHLEYNILAKNTITLDDIFWYYFKKSFIEDVICDHCSYVESETIITTFTVWRNLKELTSVFKILFQGSILYLDGDR